MGRIDMAVKAANLASAAGFNALDRNQDGLISRAEFNAALAAASPQPQLCSGGKKAAERIVVSSGPAMATPLGVPVQDACTITPALRAWIECLVDNRVDQASRSLREGDIANFVNSARREGAVVSASAAAAVQQSEHGRQRLEVQVRGLADAQARLLSVVEGLTGDAERQYSSSSKARAEALVTVERVMSTVDELQRTVEQDGDGANARLRHQEIGLEEVRRSFQDELSRQRTGLVELQRLQGEASGRQRQCTEELAGACAALASTRQEVSELAQVVQRIEMRLSAWRTEIAAEVNEEVHLRATAREAELDQDRVRLEALHREVAAASAARVEADARFEALRAEMLASLGARADQEVRLRETQQALVRRSEEAESRLDSFKEQVSSLTGARSELEARLRDGQQALSRRVDTLQAAVTKDIDATRQEIGEIGQHVQRLDRRCGTMREEVSKEIRVLSSTKDEALTLGLDAMRHEVAQHMQDIEGRMERLQVDLTTVAATREPFEFRVREGQDELRKFVESWKEGFHDELASLHRRLGNEVEAIQQLQGGWREEVMALRKRLNVDAEEWQNGLREEFAVLQRRSTVELRGEIRALLKNEQNAIAALDEQLWLTDQRLGQRIDELVQAAGRSEQRTATVAAAAELAGRSPLPPRTPPQRAQGATGLGSKAIAVISTAATSAVDRNEDSAISKGGRPARASVDYGTYDEEDRGSRPPQRSKSPQLSDTEPLDRLRAGSRTRLSQAADIEGALRRRPVGGVLAVARKAAETLDEIGKDEL